MTDAFSPDDLFQRYMAICNMALKQNENRFPFKQILGAAKNVTPKSGVEVLIIDDRPSDGNLVHLNESGKFQSLDESCKNCDCVGQWRVTRSYLEDVVNDPEKYISNPAKIDWEWMFELNK